MERRIFDASRYLEPVTPPQESKIITFQYAKAIIGDARSKGVPSIYTSGVFDVIHPGHATFLRTAKKIGGLFVVGIESDETVEMNKGATRPFNTASERLTVLSELESVDFAFAYEETLDYGKDFGRFAERIVQLRPDYLAVAADDPFIEAKENYARAAGSRLALIDPYSGQSFTRLLKLMGWEQ